MSVADNALLTQASGFTVTCWVKFDSISGNTCIVAKHADYGDVDNAGEFYIINDDGACEFVIVDDTNSASKGQIKTGVFAVDTWYHLACTYDGGTPNSSCKIYIDGVFQSQSDNATGSGFSSINNTSQPLTIGAFADAGEPHNGQISNLAMYKTELDAQTIKQMAKSRFTPMRDNRFSVVDFDGSNDYIQLPVPFSHTNHSISVWVNHSGTYKTIFSSQDSGSSGIRLRTDDGNRLQYQINGTTTTASTAYINQWVHYVCTYDGSTMLIYINGVQAQTASASQTVSTTTNARIGVNSAELSQHLSGSISSVALYNVTKDA